MPNLYTCVVELEIIPANHICSPDCRHWVPTQQRSKLIVFPKLAKSEGISTYSGPNQGNVELGQYTEVRKLP